MKFWKHWKQQNWFPYTVAACAGVILFMLLNNLQIFGKFLGETWAIVKPLLYGVILAYLIDPIARFYERKPFRKMKKEKPRRNLSVILAVVTVVIVLGGLTAAIVPSLVKSISDIIDTFSEYITMLDANAGHLSANLPFGLGHAISNFSINETMISKASEFVTANMQDIADTSMTVGNGFANFVIAFVLAIYYLMDKDRLKNMLRRGIILVIKERKYNYIHDIAARADKILLRYIKGNLIEAFIVGMTNAAFMMIARIPYVLLISIVVGITNIAPTFGPIVGAAIGTLMLVLVNPTYALIFLIFTLVLQTLDGYIIKPKLFGDTLGVSPLLILIMIILGGRICGVVGILLAIPVAAIAQFLLDDFWTRHKEKRSRSDAEAKKLNDSSNNT